MFSPSSKIRKQEWAIIGVLLILCIGIGIWLYWPEAAQDNTIAVISVDGVEHCRVDLSKTEETFLYRIEDQTGKPVSFEVKDHAIRFVDVTCPDHICEKAGWCTLPGDRAVCLPNRTSLVCYVGNELENNPKVLWLKKDKKA